MNTFVPGALLLLVSACILQTNATQAGHHKHHPGDPEALDKFFQRLSVHELKGSILHHLHNTISKNGYSLLGEVKGENEFTLRGQHERLGEIKLSGKHHGGGKFIVKGVHPKNGEFVVKGTVHDVNSHKHPGSNLFQKWNKGTGMEAFIVHGSVLNSQHQEEDENGKKQKKFKKNPFPRIEIKGDIWRPIKHVSALERVFEMSAHLESA
jgi:hypothetical protein